MVAIQFVMLEQIFTQSTLITFLIFILAYRIKSQSEIFLQNQDEFLNLSTVMFREGMNFLES